MLRVEIAFDGVVHWYALWPADGEVDLKQSINDQREQIEDIARKNVLHEPQAVQISAEVCLDKSKEPKETEYMTIYANSAYIPVDVLCWNDQEVFYAADQFLKTIYRFALHGSGRKAPQINEISIKLVKNSLIRGSFFIELWRNLRRHKKWLLNIRNTADQKCFAYCFTAAITTVSSRNWPPITKLLEGRKSVDPRSSTLSWSLWPMDLLVTASTLRVSTISPILRKSASTFSDELCVDVLPH